MCFIVETTGDNNRFVSILTIVCSEYYCVDVYIHNHKYYFGCEQWCNLLAAAAISTIFFLLWCLKITTANVKDIFNSQSDPKYIWCRVAGTSGPSDLYENKTYLRRYNITTVYSFWKPIVVFTMDGHLKCLPESIRL